jgi:ribonuclease Z
VVLYGPRGAQRILGGMLTIGIEKSRFPVEIVEVKPGDSLRRDGDDLEVFATEHRADTVGYALREHTRLGRFNPDLAREMGVPEGPLWGKLHKGETVTLPDGRRVGPDDLVGQPRAGRTIVFSGDTRPTTSLLQAARGADLLIHEATFSHEEADRAVETGHSTAQEAAVIARDAGVRQLVLTHISARYTRDAPELATEARAIFPETLVAKDGMTVEVAFPEQQGQ